MNATGLRTFDANSLLTIYAINCAVGVVKVAETFETRKLNRVFFFYKMMIAENIKAVRYFETFVAKNLVAFAARLPGRDVARIADFFIYIWLFEFVFGGFRPFFGVYIAEGDQSNDVIVFWKRKTAGEDKVRLILQFDSLLTSQMLRNIVCS